MSQLIPYLGSLALKVFVALAVTALASGALGYWLGKREGKERWLD